MKAKKRFTLIELSVMIAISTTLAAILLPVPAMAREAAGDPYPLGRCPVSDQPLGSMGEPVAMEYDGRAVQFCCAGCTRSFEENQAAHWAMIDDAIQRTQAPIYPLDTCVISGETLGAESSHDIIYRNRLVRLASDEYEKKFLEDPHTALSKLDKAVVERSLEAYPTELCAVSGEALGSHGEPIDYVVANRLVRLCCAGCIDDLRARPVQYYPDPAKAAKRAQEGVEEHDRHNLGQHEHGASNHDSHLAPDEHTHGSQTHRETNPHDVPKTGDVHKAHSNGDANASHQHGHMSSYGGGHEDGHGEHGATRVAHRAGHGGHGSRGRGHSGHRDGQGEYGGRRHSGHRDGHGEYGGHGSHGRGHGGRGGHGSGSGCC